MWATEYSSEKSKCCQWSWQKQINNDNKLIVDEVEHEHIGIIEPEYKRVFDYFKDNKRIVNEDNNKHVNNGAGVIGKNKHNWRMHQLIQRLKRQN